MQTLLLDVHETQCVGRGLKVRSFAETTMDVDTWLLDGPFLYFGHFGVVLGSEAGEKPVPGRSHGLWGERALAGAAERKALRQIFRTEATTAMTMTIWKRTTPRVYYEEL